MDTVSNVYDHTGVRIGTATATGEVYDHTGVRIGRVDGEGDVYDHTGVRIGRVRIEDRVLDLFRENRELRQRWNDTAALRQRLKELTPYSGKA